MCTGGQAGAKRHPWQGPATHRAATGAPPARTPPWAGPSDAGRARRQAATGTRRLESLLGQGPATLQAEQGRAAGSSSGKQKRPGRRSRRPRSPCPRRTNPPDDETASPAKRDGGDKEPAILALQPKLGHSGANQIQATLAKTVLVTHKQSGACGAPNRKSETAVSTGRVCTEEFHRWVTQREQT